MTVQSDSDVHFFLFFITVEWDRLGKSSGNVYFFHFLHVQSIWKAPKPGGSAVKRTDRTKTENIGKKEKRKNWNYVGAPAVWNELRERFKYAFGSSKEIVNAKTHPSSLTLILSFLSFCLLSFHRSFPLSLSLCIHVILLWLSWHTAVCGPDGRTLLISLVCVFLHVCCSMCGWRSMCVLFHIIPMCVCVSNLCVYTVCMYVNVFLWWPGLTLIALMPVSYIFDHV